MPTQEERIESLEGEVAGLLVERDRMRRKVENLEEEMSRLAIPATEHSVPMPEPEVVYIVPNPPLVRVPQMVKPEPTKPKPFIRG